jgi:HTH-type transcriptional regulator/antitoxin HigA
MSSKTPAQVLPPGEFIREELEARDWSQVELAQILGKPTQAVNEVLLGKRGITPDMALALAEAFGTSAELWMNLETSYRLSLSRGTDSQIAKRAKLYSFAPVNEMQKRGWIPKGTDSSSVERAILSFFEVESLDAQPHFAAAARKATSYAETTPSQMAWLYRAKHLAELVEVTATYSKELLRNSLARIRALAADPQELRHLPKTLADAGIRLVVIEHLPKTKIDGAAFWLDADSPVIALSCRYDRVDSIWHTVTHELAHIWNEDGRDGTVQIDSSIVGADRVPSSERPASERKIDEMACSLLVPPDELNSFIRRVRPMYSKVRIIQFANKIGIHPGIVVGQLQHREEIGYQHSREMLVKVREILTATALTDGWGYHIDL